MTGYFRSFRQMFTERVFSSRTYVVAVLQGFMLHLYMRPVAAFSRDMGYAAAPWAFPFILSNIFYLLLFKSFPICRTISYYIEAYTLINRSFEFHFMKTV